MFVNRRQTRSQVNLRVKQAQQYGGREAFTTDHVSATVLPQLPGEAASSRVRVLLIDADLHFINQLTDIVSDLACDLVTAASFADALPYLRERDTVDVVVMNPHATNAGEGEIRTYLDAYVPEVPCIAVLDVNDVEGTTTGIETDTIDYLEYLRKPIPSALIRESLRTMLQKSQRTMELRRWRRALSDDCDAGSLLTKTPAMYALFERMRVAAATDGSVVIEGESGTEKKLIAQAIHRQSSRRWGALVSLTCAGVTDTALEGELLGFARRAFSGATFSAPGKLTLATHGTLFIDDIDRMSVTMQAKLLSTLRSHTIQLSGRTNTRQIDIRLIVASSVPLEKLVASGLMDPDFYAHIHALVLRVPALRERRADIPLLAQDYIAHHPVAVKRHISGLTPAVRTALLTHTWPGNVDELYNVLERAIVLTHGGVVTNISLSPPLLPGTGTTPYAPPLLSLRQWLHTQERQYLCRQLRVAGGNLRMAAEYCGINTRTFFRKLRRYRIDRQQFCVT